jgi:hypothetical protein
VARQQAQEARKSRELSAVVSLFNAHQSEDASRMRRLIRFYEPAKACWEQCAKPYVREVRATQNEDFARDLQQWIGAPDPCGAESSPRSGDALGRARVGGLP